MKKYLKHSIRPATEKDWPEISKIHKEAFGEKEGPEIVQLVLELLKDETAKPFFSLIVEIEGRRVGHVLFTHAIVGNHTQHKASILAPVGILKDFQGKGLGRSLIEEGLKILRESNVSIVFVLGYPEYYKRFGFKPAGALGFEAPYPIPAKHSDAWMVLELIPVAIGKISGVVRCASALDKEKYWRE